LPEGGLLKIGTRIQDGAFVEILVEDNGAGMAPEVLDRAIEPFFTTKPTGKGTGLGLSQVFNTARAHGGYLRLESELGKGTRAIIGLPCRPVESAGVPSEASMAAVKALKILLVDDEDLVRSTMPMMLGFVGHQVTPVAGGQEALDYLADHEVPDLILLDMNMPGMTGMETWTEIRKRFKDLPILVATGFLEDRVSVALAADPRAAAIAKPYSLREFQSALARFASIRNPASTQGCALEQSPARMGA
jgi:CheY-like chemotaxis protein